MNEALENDELKKEPPRERGLGLGFGVVSVEILDQRGNSKKPETPKVFLPNTYVLLLRDEDRTLFYLDYEENKKIKGLV